MRDTNLQVNEKNSLKDPPPCILPSFSQNTSQLLLLKWLWKFESTTASWKCKRKVLLLVIYLFIQVNFLHVDIWYLKFSWGFPWVHFLSNKLGFFVSCNNISNNIKITGTSCFALCFDMPFHKKVIVLHHSHYTFLFWHLCQIHTFIDNLND